MVFDELQLFRGGPYKINDHISIKHPTVDEICKYGEENYYSLVYRLTAIPSYYKVQLYDAGIDYMEVSDFNFFHYMCSSLPEQASSIFFDNVNLSALEGRYRTDTQESVLYDPVNQVVIDEMTYIVISEYIRKLHDIEKKVEKAGNEKSKIYFIERDRRKMERLKDKPFVSQLKPIISALVNCEKFKYDHDTVWKLPIYALYDSLQQINRSISYEHVMQGCYAGTLDMDKLDRQSKTWIELSD